MNNGKITEAELSKQGYVRGYHRHSKAWYGKIETVRPSNTVISFGMYHKDSGCYAEMTAEWIPLRSGHSPEVKAFDDSWALFGLFWDLFEKLGEYHGKNVNEEEFSTILDWFGFKDLTQYENPKDKAEKEENEKYLAGQEAATAKV